MNYEQTKHKINNEWVKTNQLKSDIDKVNYNTESLKKEQILSKIFYLQSDWIDFLYE